LQGVNIFFYLKSMAYIKGVASPTHSGIEPMASIAQFFAAVPICIGRTHPRKTDLFAFFMEEMLWGGID
jgi:hypothetical protein